MALKKHQWLINAAEASGLVLDGVDRSAYIYPLDALYSSLGGELTTEKAENILPFGLPSSLVISLGHNKKYKNSIYHFRSTLDGRRHTLSEEKLKQWLNCFAQVVLPKEMASLVLGSKVSTFIDHEENYNKEFLGNINSEQGVALHFSSSNYLALIEEITKSLKDHQFYIYGSEINDTDFQILSRLKNVVIQTNAPLIKAQDGLVCAKNGFDIRALAYELDQAPLESECQCQTCLNYTRSYLHHLYKHTPILAVQLLAQHNYTHYLSI